MPVSSRGTHSSRTTSAKRGRHLPQGQDTEMVPFPLYLQMDICCCSSLIKISPRRLLTPSRHWKGKEKCHERRRRCHYPTKRAKAPTKPRAGAPAAAGRAQPVTGGGVDVAHRHGLEARGRRGPPQCSTGVGKEEPDWVPGNGNWPRNSESGTKQDCKHRESPLGGRSSESSLQQKTKS